MRMVRLAGGCARGLLLGINYIYSRNLWFLLFFHLSWNFFQGPILDSGLAGLVCRRCWWGAKGDLFITGGEFGLEVRS